MSKPIIIGSRGSKLALWQAHYVQDLLESNGHEVEIEIIKTQGDKIQHLSFDKMEGKGFFTKELEAALLNRSIDLAVHSHKDMETTQPSGLAIAAVSERGPVEDVLLAREGIMPDGITSLPQGSVVGTGSARRKAQLVNLRPDIVLKDLRGNVPTRIGKLRDGEYDAIVLAHAGLSRLELDLGDLDTDILELDEFVPAPAQGALALQIREDDKRLHEILQVVNDPITSTIVGFERKVLRMLEGGCLLPLGAHCTKHLEGWTLRIFYAPEIGLKPIISELRENSEEKMNKAIEQWINEVKA